MSADLTLLMRENARLRCRIMVLEGELAGASGAFRGVATVLRDEGEPERAEVLEERADEMWRLSRPKKEALHG